MELLSPLTSADEVDPLIDAGATELYAGVITPEWRRAFSTLVAGNRRDTQSANFPSLEALATAVEAAHARRVPVYLTVNLAYYTPSQEARVAALMDAAAGMGVDAFIIADLATMLRARREHPDVKLHVSTIAPCFNASALRFYAALGASRAVLPQHLTVDEIEALARDSPLELEAFVLNYRCANVDGFCTFMHGIDEATRPGIGGPGHALLHSRWALALARVVPRRVLGMARRLPGLGSAPCLLEYAAEPVTLQALALEELAAARARMAARFRGKTGLDCGACVLRTLLRAGVRAAKIDGRSNDPHRKVQDVRFLAPLIRAAGDGSVTDEELSRRTREGFGAGYHGECTRVSCYYPEFLP